MSHKEVRRPGLVQAALQSRITNREGARALGLSVRQFRRLKAQYRSEGVRGLLHQNRGRPSSRRTSTDVRERVLTLLRTTYWGFNDHHFTEKLRESEGIVISRELVRRIRRAAQIAPVHRRRPTQYRARRLRESREGALVLLDGSTHAWFGKEASPCTLLGAIDDATGTVLALHFRPHEDLHGYTELLRRVAMSQGLPVQLYGDRLNVFIRNDVHWSLDEELAGTRKPTQFGAMLAELAIGYIPAQSPQAKGRIERLWRTLQDRLVSELRLRRCRTMPEGEDFLESFLPDFNRRFMAAPRDAITAWRRPPRHFASILACRYERVVARDNTVTIPGRWAQIPPGPGKRSYHRRRVEVREQLDGALLIFWQGRLIARQPAPTGPFTLISRAAGSSSERRKMLGLDRPRIKRLPPPLPQPPPPAPWSQPRRTLVRHSAQHPWKRKTTLTPQQMAAARTKPRCR